MGDIYVFLSELAWSVNRSGAVRVPFVIRKWTRKKADGGRKEKPDEGWVPPKPLAGRRTGATRGTNASAYPSLE